MPGTTMLFVPRVAVATGLRRCFDDEREQPKPMHSRPVMMRQRAPKAQPTAMPTTEAPGGWVSEIKQS